MSAAIFLARERISDRIVHISDVDKTKHLRFYCIGCCLDLIPVKSEARKKDWHFRHLVDTDCTGKKDRALHDYAVQIILENRAVAVSDEIHLNYTNPRKEVVVFNADRSDATVTSGDTEVHFEVFVTNDLSDEKVNAYKAYKIKCVRINLSDKVLLGAEPETIEDLVLRQTGCKRIIYWKDNRSEETDETNKAPRGTNVGYLIGTAFIVLAARWLYNKIFKPKRQRRR